MTFRDLQKQDESNKSIDEEFAIQSNLNKARNSFCYDEIIAAKVIECKTLKGNLIEYDNNTYEIKKNKNESNYYTTDATIYLPVFVLNYNGLQQTFTTGWFGSEKEANNKLNEIQDIDSFVYKIKSDNVITYCKNNNILYKLINSSDTVQKYIKLDGVLLTLLPILFALLLSPLLIDMFSLNIPQFNLGLLLSAFSTIFVITQLCLSYIQENNFTNYYYTDIPSKKIMRSNSDEIDYKVISCDINIDDSGLTIHSDELDCTWFYERKKNKLLSENGQKLVQNLPTDENKCIITVKNDGYSNSAWISSDERWWIDIKTSFN